jgi:hypothetical protein
VYYALQSSPNLLKSACLSLSLVPKREPSSYDPRHRLTQKHHEGTPGVRSDTKHRQLARQVGGVLSINGNSMAIIFKSKITFIPGAIFYFRTISCIEDVEGTLHRIATPPKKKSSSGIPQEARVKLRAVPQLTERQCMVPRKSGLRSPQRVEGQSTTASPTRRTPLSTSPTKECTRITGRREMDIPYQGMKGKCALGPFLSILAQANLMLSGSD